MRIAGAALVASIAALAAPSLLGSLAQSDQARAQVTDPSPPRLRFAEAAKKNAPPIAKKGAPTAKDAKGIPPATKGAPAPQPAANPYAAVPLPERLGIQIDLAFAGYYNGLITGDFNDRTMAAVRAFQKASNLREGGALAPPERATLAARSKAKQEQVGFRIVDDRVTGARLGLPTTQVPNASRNANGSRWSSAQGQVQVETFRIREPGTTLAAVFEQQKKEPAGRKLDVNLLRNDFFILSGTQGLKKFYVRAEAKDQEVRGMTILWDPATEGVMDPLVVVMSSAFTAFPGTGTATTVASLLGPPPRRKVDYGTGIVVSTQGHIIADRQVMDDCNVVQVAGYGDAEQLTDDAASGLSLLRIYGAPDFKPASLVPDGARSGELTLIGIADPQSQGGGRTVSSVPARLNGDNLQPVPQLGFAGAAVLDGQGRIAGMVALKTPVVASAGAFPPPQATLVPVDTIRKFLADQSVTPASGGSGADAAKATLVRLICVRR